MLAELGQLVEAWTASELSGPTRCWATLRKALERLELMAEELGEDAQDLRAVLTHLHSLTEPRELGGPAR